MTRKEFELIHEFLQAMVDTGKGIRNSDTGEIDAMISFKQINNFSKRVAMLIDDAENAEGGAEEDD